MPIQTTNRFDIFRAAQEPFLDEAEGASFLRAARDRFGVLNLSYWFLGTSNDVPDRMNWYSTYDQTYTAIYMRDYSPIRDRAFHLCFSRLLPVDWDEARESDQTVEHIHQLAERFGIGRHGISIPIRDAGLGDALFSINFDCDREQWGRLRAELANQAHVFGHYYHRRMRGLIGGLPPASSFDLSPREREVLRWAAEGMTAAQTARLLKVSESAINLYSARAMSKLQARSKTHAVAIAVRNKLLQ